MNESAHARHLLFAETPSFSLWLYQQHLQFVLSLAHHLISSSKASLLATQANPSKNVAPWPASNNHRATKQPSQAVPVRINQTYFEDLHHSSKPLKTRSLDIWGASWLLYVETCTSNTLDNQAKKDHAVAQHIACSHKLIFDIPINVQSRSACCVGGP